MVIEVLNPISATFALRYLNNFAKVSTKGQRMEGVQGLGLSWAQWVEEEGKAL